MKNRIKKFYQDHEAGITTALGAGALLGALFGLHMMKGQRLTSADIWTRDDGMQLITVGHKNGTTTTFSKEATSVA